MRTEQKNILERAGKSPRYELCGKKFGQLRVLEVVRNELRIDAPKYRCLCDCGKEIVLLSGRLTSGFNRSCGCKSRRGIRHGLRSTPTYNTWYSMLERCRNPKNASWRYYGAKGIRVCARWQSLALFIADMGMRPDGMTLDRINPDGDYERTNCRWSTSDVQQRTRRSVVCNIQFARDVRAGKYAGLKNKAIAEIMGCDVSTISRIKSGKAWIDA